MKETEKNSFIFYKSFYEALKNLPAEDFKKIIIAICEKALFEKENNNLEYMNKIIFTLIAPQIEANNKKYLDGKKGGRPKSIDNSIKKTSGFENKKPVVIENKNQWLKNKKPNVNVNDNVNVNVNDNENVNDNANDFIQELNNKIPSIKEVYDIINKVDENNG